MWWGKEKENREEEEEARRHRLKYQKIKVNKSDKRQKYNTAQGKRKYYLTALPNLCKKKKEEEENGMEYLEY